MKLLFPYPHKNIKFLIYLMVIGALTIIGLKLLAVYIPSHLCWGFNHLTFTPSWVWITLASIALLAMIPSTNHLIWCIFDYILDVTGKIFKGNKKYLLFSIISFLALLIFWFLRSKKLWGDGGGTIALLDRTLATDFWGTFYWREPLDRLITILFYKILHITIGWDAWNSIALISCLAGALYIYYLLRVCDKLSPNMAGKFIIFLFLITMGKVQLFFGHVENYTLVAAGTIAYILFSILYLKKQSSLFAPVITLAVTICIHPLSLALTPSLIYLIWLEIKNKPNRQKITILIQAVCLFSIPIILLVVICLFFGAPGLDINFNRFDRHPQLFLPIRDIFNPLHLKDIANEHILISPVGLMTIVLIFIFSFGRINFSDKKFIFLSIASIAFIIFTLTFHSTWEQKRDWDVLSTAATPYTLLAGYLVVSTIRPKKYMRYISLVLIVTALLNTAPWILSNSLGLSEYSADYLKYHRRGLRFAHHGNFKIATENFFRALKINPEFSPSLLSLGAVYSTQGKLMDAKGAFKRITNLFFSGQNAREAHYNLGIIYANQGQNKLALKHLRRVIEMDYFYPQAQTLINALQMDKVGRSEY